MAVKSALSQHPHSAHMGVHRRICTYFFSMYVPSHNINGVCIVEKPSAEDQKILDGEEEGEHEDREEAGSWLLS